jgi:hypothetical protein
MNNRNCMFAELGSYSSLLLETNETYYKTVTWHLLLHLTQYKYKKMYQTQISNEYSVQLLLPFHLKEIIPRYTLIKTA